MPSFLQTSPVVWGVGTLVLGLIAFSSYRSGKMSEKKPPKVEPGTRVKIQYKKAFWVDVVAVTVADQNLKARPPLFLD